LEERINKRTAESIEQLGEIIKDYARKQRKNNERLSDLEVKLFGNSKDPIAKKTTVKRGRAN